MVRVAFCVVAAAAVVSSHSTSSDRHAADHASASCPIPCHHGRCVEVELGTVYKCDCDPADSYTLLGYSGPSCDIPYKQCPDYERRCYNNAECAMSSTTPGKFVCDCSAAYGVSSFAGHECQYSATEVCEAFTPVAEDAFCVNGGRCRSTVLAGEDHPGCDCPDEFEGSKCQFLKGTAPPNEGSNSGSNSRGSARPRGEGTTDMHPGIIALIVIVALTVVGAFAYMIYAKRKDKTEGIEKEGELDKATIESDGFANDERPKITGQDMELHPDGSGTLGVASVDDGDGGDEEKKSNDKGAEGGDGGNADGKKDIADDVEIL